MYIEKATYQSDEERCAGDRVENRRAGWDVFRIIIIIIIIILIMIIMAINIIIIMIIVICIRIAVKLIAIRNGTTNGNPKWEDEWDE